MLMQFAWQPKNRIAIILGLDHTEHVGPGQWYTVTFDDKVLSMHEDYLHPV
jgi:hypothetical protein